MIEKIKEFFNREDTRAKFTEILNGRANAYIASFLQILESKEGLQLASITSLFNAAIAGATIDLPLNTGLNYAYVTADREDSTGLIYASFNVGWRGFVQLALRTEMYKSINVSDVREGELKNRDRLTGDYEFKWVQDEKKRNALPVIGHVAHFSLMSGFSKSNYRSIDEIKAHGQKYSKEYGKEGSKWDLDFEQMANKTVIKELLRTYGVMSTALKMAVIADQALINNIVGDNITPTYPDNPIKKESEKTTAEKTEAAIIKRSQAAVNSQKKVIESLTTKTRKPAKK